MADFTITPYHPKYQPRFYALNQAWIEQFYVMEEEDKQFLADPESHIIAKDGEIFFLLEGDEVMGCCGVMKMGDGVYELVRMAVDERARGKGYGVALIEHAIEWTKTKKASQLILETGIHNNAAVALYSKLGFEHYTPDPKHRSGLERATVFMHMKLTDAQAA
ncbi:MAG: GNAT family N-acetyltransferase [Rickettsiales bacterium]